MEYRIISKDDSVKWVWEQGQGIFSKKGEVLALEGFITDITDRKITENALIESEKYNRTIVEVIPDMIIKTNRKGEYLDIITSSDADIPVEKESVLGKTIREVLPENEIGKVMNAIEKSIDENSIQSVEYQLQMPSGKCWFEARIISSNPDEVYALIRDITERKHAETELKKSYEELKELDRLKSEFTALISHEIRTPLTSIKGYVDLVLDETMGELNENQKMCLHTVSDNVSRLARLISDVLDISKIERGEFRLNRGPINLKNTLEKVLKELIPIATKKRINLKLDVNDLATNADKDRMAQVFTNLIENAIKFSPENTEVIISGKEELNEKIHITIQDQGIGIANDEFDKIFDRFYQIDASNKRKIGGTGLGLAVCKNIIHAHDGKIWVESEIGKGSTFHVVLPKNLK